MTSTREGDITAAFVNLANSLVDDFDVVDLLGGLATDCVRLLDIAAAGVLLADRHDVLHIVAASSEATRDLELFQLQRDEGPCLDCYRGGVAVSAPDLPSQRDRWPYFVEKAGALGFASVHAVPMRLQTRVLGTLGLFGSETGPLSDQDLSLAQALAHVGTVAIAQGSAVADAELIAKRLQHALTSRVVLEQAKGILAQRGSLAMDEAFAVLRRYARDLNLRLDEVARALVARDLSPQMILDHTTSKTQR